MFYTKKFSLVGETGQEVGAVVLEHLWADVYGIKIKEAELINAAQWERAFELALQDARSRSAREVILRITVTEGSSNLGSRLLAMGFQKKHDRAEFRRPVEALPDDSGSPMTWKTAQELSWRDVDIASKLGEIAKGDPDPDAQTAPLTFIQDMLADPVLTSGLDCFHFGFFEGKVAALTVVQMNPKSGWSRISYMGVMPEYRKRGLGKWVHRYSFRQMKAQGGKLYHGGTVCSNQAMIRLFEAHQCERFLEMEEWVYTMKGGAR